ncbi:MAG: tetratricopeptide repeat protein [Gemmataceae bacterium]|nr:tetratricopeptide repeat protein [Gemmataceae bacterium]
MRAFTTTREGRTVLIAVGALLLLTGGLAVYLWWPSAAAVPPEVPLEGLDREVVQVIESARADALKNPRSGSAWGHLGRALMANEVYPEIGLVCFREAGRLDPTNPRWPYFEAVHLQRLGKPEEVVAKLQRAVDLSRQTGVALPSPSLLLAETLLSLAQPESAERHFREVLSTDGRNLRAQFGLGMLAYSRGQWPACRTHLEACLGTPEARKKAAAQLATVCDRLGDRDWSKKYADLAARFPRDVEWNDPLQAEHSYLARRKRDRLRTAERLEAEGRLPEAADTLMSLVNDYPDDYLPHLALGKVLPRLGEFRLAEQHLEKARELAPDKIHVHYLLSLVFLQQGEALKLARGGDGQKAQALFEKTIKAAREVLAVNPNYGWAYMPLGLALKHLGKTSEAVTALRQAVHRSPEFADLHRFLGETLAEVGELREARSCLEQAALLAGPNDPRPRVALKRLLAKD